jgi:pimeloyl-ACP methyl ester carboxylesterase
MRPEEINALGVLAGDAAAGFAVQVREMHKGIAQRAFQAVGAAAAPIQLAHDQIADRAYSVASGLTGALVRGGARAASTARPPDAASIEQTISGRVAMGALNGAFGDALHKRESPLEMTMALRRGGQEIPPSADALATRFADATPRLAVFAHGLCETDDAWKLGADRHTPYGARLQSELGYTPLYIRYNTGRHISENGRELAQLLRRITDSWPVEVDEIALVGHSMGGLVARSACHYGGEHEWTSKVRHVFTLGAPHLGAPLEQVTHAASVALSRLPETRGIAKALNARSAGIKDLRHGYLVDEDWSGHDPDAFLRRASREIPFLRSANHYFVCATLSRDADHPVGRVIGDLLVLRASAWAHGNRGERMQFPIDHYRHIGAANHFDLLNHPAIYEQIGRWLSARPALAAPAQRP